MKIKNSGTYFTLAMVAFLTLGVAFIQAAPISIAEARNAAIGTVVTIEGEVTVPSGAFVSAMFDEGFQIQDDTGGIYVSVADNLGFKVGDWVQVTGATQSNFELLMLAANAADVVALPRSTKQILATGAVNENTEGFLLTVQGTITRPIIDDRPFGFKVYIDDGSGELQIFIHESLAFSPLDLSFLTPGNTIRVTGTSAQFLDEYEITPRFRRDIKRINNP